VLTATTQTTYKATRQTIKSDVARNLHENKRSLKLVEEVKSTIMAHSAGITELSNHLTAMRSFQYQADAERRERAHRGNQATRSNAPKRSRGSADADIFDPDASPMLPPDQRALDASGLPREPRKVQLAADERKNLGDNPAVLRNMVRAAWCAAWRCDAWANWRKCRVSCQAVTCPLHNPPRRT